MSRKVISIAAALLACIAAASNADQSNTSGTGTSQPVTASAAPQSAPAPSATPGAAAPATTTLNIAFDQVDRTLNGSATPPPPNAFADEVQIAKDAQNPQGFSIPGMNLGQQIGNLAMSQIPVVGSIFQMGQAKKQMDAMKKQQQAMLDRMSGLPQPVLTRYAFYNGWTRVETANSIIITKPDKNQTIFLDPKAKTYRTYDMSAAAQLQQAAPSASAAPAAAGAPQLPAQASGGATALSMISWGQADATTLEGQQASGYSTEAILTLSQSEGACHDGSFRAKELVYFANMPEPLPQPKAAPIDTLALPDGCTPTIDRKASGTDARPLGQMYLYRLITVVRDPNAATQTASSSGIPDPSVMMQQMMGGARSKYPPNYMLLSQRGNIRQLTANDASLFDIPSDYKQDQ